MESYIVGFIALVIGVVIAFPLGIQYRKQIAEKELGTAEAEAKRIVSEAIKSAEVKKKEALVEAKDEIFRLKSEAEREMKERRNEVTRLERRVQHKEETVDKKIDNLDKKEEALQQKLQDAETKLEEAETVKKSQFDLLEKISGFTGEQAKEYLLKNLEEELTHEKALRISQMESRLKEEADLKARNIISLAIQRCAADQVAETTVSVVPLPAMR